jgi:cytochrome c oxidase subunit II
MGKLLAVVLVLIAVSSAVPILMHIWWMPEDISTHGHMIDHQMSETMAESGIAFVAAQLVLAGFIGFFGESKDGRKAKHLPGGAKLVVIAAIALVGTEVLALGVFGKDAWAEVYFKKAAAEALPIQVQAEQFGFYFRYAGPDGKFGPMHPDKIDEGNQNFFGLDPANDVDSRDDIVAASLVIPVNKPISLMMHAKDVGHSFYVRELRIQQDFVPGLDIPMHFTATKVGKYEIVCTQLCGLGHFNMRAFLEVKSQDEFDQWLKQQSQ